MYDNRALDPVSIPLLYSLWINLVICCIIGFLCISVLLQVLEIIFYRYPDNPSGVKRDPLVKDPSRVVRDMVYYWPMYTEIDTKLDQPLMVFSRYAYVSGLFVLF